MDESGSAPTLLAAWTFHRHQEWLTIRREAMPDGNFQLVVIENNVPRQYQFDSLVRLGDFQFDLETPLVNSGWTLAAYTPDLRQGAERRTAGRDTGDRRRPWTNVRP